MAATHGALLGLLAYGTYDMTNMGHAEELAHYHELRGHDLGWRSHWSLGPSWLFDRAGFALIARRIKKNGAENRPTYFTEFIVS